MDEKISGLGYFTKVGPQTSKMKILKKKLRCPKDHTLIVGGDL